MEDRSLVLDLGVNHGASEFSRHGERGVGYLCMDVCVYTYLILCCDVICVLYLLSGLMVIGKLACHRFQFLG